MVAERRELFCHFKSITAKIMKYIQRACLILDRELNKFILCMIPSIPFSTYPI